MNARVTELAQRRITTTAVLAIAVTVICVYIATRGTTNKRQIEKREEEGWGVFKQHWTMTQEARDTGENVGRKVGVGDGGGGGEVGGVGGNLTKYYTPGARAKQRRHTQRETKSNASSLNHSNSYPDPTFLLYLFFSPLDNTMEPHGKGACNNVYNRKTFATDVFFFFFSPFFFFLLLGCKLQNVKILTESLT